MTLSVTTAQRRKKCGEFMDFTGYIFSKEGKNLFSLALCDKV